MEDLLAQERAAEQNVYHLLSNTDEPIVNVLKAFEDYRTASESSTFADFEHGVAKKEAALWQAHVEGKKYFHRALSPLRKQPNEQSVTIRQLIKLYLQFLKGSQRFYRGYIHHLNTAFGGIPELEAVAHQVKKDDSGESLEPATSPSLRKKVLNSCHQALIYLGDLSRYRASDKLDKNPDFGPAIGYYGLACTLFPSSGLGHHQQAVVALDQQHHLRAIYHLYRAIVVEEAHPNAASNLKREFDKTNAAWDRGELIQKSVPNDPESAKRTLVGWFVRLHSMCFKGEPFRGYEELEREVLGQLAAELKHRSLDATLQRMIMTNLAAQFYASEKFQENPVQPNQDAFLHFFRFNIKTFTALLRVFYDSLRSLDLTKAHNNDDELELATRLTEIARRILPSLRLYSYWLLPLTHLLDGLSGDEILKDAIDQFWPIYAKVVDLVAAVFPIWDLEDVVEVHYMLEEDVEILGFKPLISEKTDRIWRDKTTGLAKARFSNMDVQRVSVDEEMLKRIEDFLADGLYLANDDDSAPIKLQSTRILHRDAQDVVLPLPTVAKKVASAAPSPNGPAVRPPSGTKHLSYAAAAAAAAAVLNSKTTATTPKPTAIGPASVSATSQDAQLMRMVDDLVEEGPTTPPQAMHSNPAIATRPDVPYVGAQGFLQRSSYSYQAAQKPIGTGPGVERTPPVLRTPKDNVTSKPLDRMQAVSSIWHGSPGPQPSSFPSGLPTGTLGSPAQFHTGGHSRVNSASSIRSRTSQTLIAGIGDSWSSLESAPRLAAGFGMESTNVASPLLFGAGDSVWSTSPNPAYRNVSPPNGQG